MQFEDEFASSLNPSNGQGGDASQSPDPDAVKDVDRILDRLATGQRLITMAGPAGSGKTERIAHLVKVYPGSVCVVAYTGQAVRMLQKRGISATTIHSLIYKSRAKNHQKIASVTGSLRKLEQTSSDPARINALHKKLEGLQAPGFVLNKASPLADADLCIIDEAGMCDSRIARDLESFGKPILVVGDPYQLKPIYGDAYYDLRNPDVPLTKIYRHGEASGILALATATREAQSYDRASLGPDVGIIRKSLLRPKEILGHCLWADRIITATNDTRREINRSILSALKLGRYPSGNQNEKLICLNNYWDVGLLNGSPVRLAGVEPDKSHLWLTAQIERDDGDDVWTDCGVHRIYLGHFDATARSWRDKKADRARQLDDAHIDQHDLIELDWAFATTCHKAQGSEWPNVLIIQENWPTNRADRRRWQYTAVTRARSQLKIIENWDRE